MGGGVSVLYVTLIIDSQSRRTVAPLPGPPSLLEPSEDKVLADSCSSRLSRRWESSLRSFRLRDVVIGGGRESPALRSRKRCGPTRP